MEYYPSWSVDAIEIIHSSLSLDYMNKLLRFTFNTSKHQEILKDLAKRVIKNGYPDWECLVKRINN